MLDEALSRAATRQTLTATTFVDIVATLLGEFDVVDVLTALTSHCVELLDASAAGILLVDVDGRLRVIGASTQAIELLELFQIQGDEGPSVDCFRSGKVVLHSDSDTVSLWPLFGPECTRAGFASVCAVPMRLKSHVIGCLNMFMADSRGLTDIDVGLAQALAGVATIAIIQDQATRDSAIREGHLQHALTSRISIEQAKGMVANGAHINMDDAFARVRAHARNHNRSLTNVADALVSGALAVESLAKIRPPPRRPKVS